MKQVRVFGTLCTHKPTKKESMKINGYEYSDTEVLEALKKRSYQIVPFKYEFTDESFPIGPTWEKLDVVCAVKPGEEPKEENIWWNVAKVEFTFNEKPKLV